ncbi:MAG: hypothetical protein K2G99_04060, partial [Desulfovibrio sp.]|nr:hypothetical protein [Desulfovibrio sp.]
MLTVEELKQELRPLLTEPAATSTPDGAASAAAWLDALALRLEDGRLTVGFPHSYFARWFSAHKQANFERALGRCFPGLAVVFSEEAAAAPRPLAPRARASHAENAVATGGDEDAEPAEAPVEDGPEDARADAFARFIVNAKNAFPLATAKNVAAGGVPDGGILVFCGKSGTGKTQLLEAMARALSERLGPGRVRLCGAARFCDELAGPQASPGHAELFWQGRHALLLDDVQDLAGEARWQRALAGLMDARPKGRLLICAHAGPATELARLEGRRRPRRQRGRVRGLLEAARAVRQRDIQP